MHQRPFSLALPALLSVAGATLLTACGGDDDNVPSTPPGVTSMSHGPSSQVCVNRSNRWPASPNCVWPSRAVVHETMTHSPSGRAIGSTAAVVVVDPCGAPLGRRQAGGARGYLADNVAGKFEVR